MSDPQGTLELVGKHLTLALRPLIDGLGDLAHFKQLMYRLGWKVTGLPPEYTSLGDAVGAAVSKLEGLSADPSPADIAGLLQAAKSAYEAILGITTAPPGVDAGAFLAEIGERLFELLLTDYLALELPAVYNLFKVANVIQLEPIKAGSGRPSIVRTNFQWSEIPNIISQPQVLPKLVYGWGTANLNVQRIVDHLAELFLALGLPVQVQTPDQALAVEYASLSDEPFPDVAHSLTIPFWSGTIANKRLVAAFALRDLPAAGGELPGLVLEPQIPSEFPLNFPLTDTVNLRLLAGTNAASLFGILIRPDAVAIKYPFAPGTTPPQAGVGIGVDFKPPAAVIIFGDKNATRLTLQGASMDLTVVSVDGQFGLDLVAQLTGLTLILDGSESDSFVQAFIGNGETQIGIPLGVECSNRYGLRFKGSSAFEVELHPNFSLGPVHIDDLTIQLAVPTSRPPDLTLKIGAAITGELGPVQFAVQGIGLQVATTFGGGNVGPIDLSLAFKAPSGLGISVDAAVVSGGGFLNHEGDEYGGALDLAVTDIAVKAFGVVQTKLPGDVPGYSFIIALSVEFSPSIQLPFGFSLDGVGGIVGINRTISIDAVQTALWAHHLDGLLFPKDLIASAPQLITALDSYFPPANGRYLIGPMAKIGWGDGIVEGEIALLLELPEPLKLLLLGEIEVGVPMEKPQLELHISFAGGLDFGKKLAFFDATLHDSRIESFPITGDLAFRDGWGDDGSFALALGGFNPHFQPPASFPTLKRLAITIGSSVAQIEAQAYIALTANTLQFGARAEITAGTGSFNVHGWLGIDALCERHPMSFTFDLSGGIDLRHGTDVLASVHLDGHLSGPTPWHVSGEASLSLFLFDVTVHFDKTWGQGADGLPLPDPLSFVLAALANASSFRSVLPAGVRTLVSLIDSPTDANQALLLEPAGSLRIAQRVLPFGQPITRFGGAPLGRTVQLSMDDVTAFTTTFQQTPTTTEEFAPAQYFEFSDAEKLSLPSFTKFDAGVEIAGDAIDLGSSARSRAVVTPFTYDTTIFDSVSKRPGKDYTLGIGALLAMNGRALAQPTGLGRYAPHAGTPSRVTLAPDRWVIAGANDLVLRPDITSDGSKVGAQLALKRFLAANADQRGQLQVVMFEEAA